MNADNKGGSSSRLLDASKSAPATPNLTSTRAALAFVDRPIHLACLIVPLLLASCTTPKDGQHHVVISMKNQKLALLDRQILVASYPASTSKYELSDGRGCHPFT